MWKWDRMTWNSRSYKHDNQGSRDIGPADQLDWETKEYNTDGKGHPEAVARKQKKAVNSDIFWGEL